MGSFMARLFADLGHTVMIADVDTPLTPAEAAATADVVVISVPIDATEAVIRDLGPRMRPDASGREACRDGRFGLIWRGDGATGGANPRVGPACWRGARAA